MTMPISGGFFYHARYFDKGVSIGEQSWLIGNDNEAARRQRGEILHMLVDTGPKVDNDEIIVFLQRFQISGHGFQFFHRQRRVSDADPERPAIISKPPSAILGDGFLERMPSRQDAGEVVRCGVSPSCTSTLAKPISPSNSSTWRPERVNRVRQRHRQPCLPHAAFAGCDGDDS